MARCPLVRPDTVRVTLKDGEYMELKKELTSGEYRQMWVQQMKDTAMGDRPVLDMQVVAVSKMLTYLVDWSFVDFAGNPLAVSRESLDKLDIETFKEIDAVVDAHHDAWEKAVDARKNAQDGAIKPEPISSSAA